MSSERIAVVIGASRGIGLEFVKQLKTRGYRVLGSSRKPLAEESLLKSELSEQNHLTVDLADHASIPTLTAQLKAKGIQKIDLVVNNAGILYRDDWTKKDPIQLAADINEQLNLNSTSPVLVLLALRQFLTQGSKYLVITSNLGSIAETSFGGVIGYRMSKAAVNMAVKTMSLELQKDGVIIFGAHPGLVATDMNPQGQISTTTSVTAMIDNVVDKVDISKTGGFFHYEGRSIPF